MNVGVSVLTSHSFSTGVADCAATAAATAGCVELSLCGVSAAFGREAGDTCPSLGEVLCSDVPSGELAPELITGVSARPPPIVCDDWSFGTKSPDALEESPSANQGG